MRAKRFLGALLLSSSICFGLIAPMVPQAQADANVQDGLQLMQQKNYPRAVASFEQALRVNPSNQSALYCLGTCYYEMKNLANAKSYYESAVKANPNSATGKAAMTALKSLSQPARQGSAGAVRTTSYSSHNNTSISTATTSGAGRMGSGQESSEPQEDLSRLPSDSRVRFHRKVESGGDHLYVDAHINNRPITMMFDTGAEECSIGFNHLSQLGLATPTGKPFGEMMGMGTKTPKKAWRVLTTIRVGNIERKNFPIMIKQGNEFDALIGQSFLKAFHYTVEADSDPSTGSIRFTRSSGRNSGSIYQQRDTHSEVPYTREGKEMLVTVQIDGKAVPMYFDTGAAGVSIPRHLAKSMNISIPGDAQESVDMGTSGGQARALIFPIRSIKLGPIEKTNFDIRVVDEPGLKRGLVGQSLFHDWRYTIDSTNNVIKFRR